MGRKLALLLGLLALVAVIWLGFALVLDDNPAPSIADPDTSAAIDARSSVGPSNVRARSRRPGQFSGALQTAHDQAPARLVAVVVQRDGADVQSVETDRHGRFITDDLPAGTGYDVTVSVEGYAPIALRGLELRPGERRDLGVLLLAAGVRTRVIVRSLQGEALPGAQVAAHRLIATRSLLDGPKAVAVETQRTDEGGVATFEALARGRWALVATRAGYARRGVSPVELATGDEERTITLHLDRGHTLAGRVIDGDRQPIAGAQVLAIRRSLSSDSDMSALTQRVQAGPDGSFRFDQLPAADIILWAGRPGAPMAVASAVRVPLVKNIDVVLTDGGRIEGKVVDLGGDPVAGAEIEVITTVLGNFSLTSVTESGEDGSFSLIVPMSGSISQITARRDGYADGKDERLESHEFTARAGVVYRTQLVLRPAVQLRGRVLGPAGPIAEAALLVLTSHRSLSAETDEDGGFALDLSDDDDWVVGVASATGHRLASDIAGVSQDVHDAIAAGKLGEALSILSQFEGPLHRRLPPAPAIVEMDIRLETATRKGVPLRGRVIDSGGLGIAQASVSTPGVKATQTGEDGSFDLPEVESSGALRIRVRHAAFIPTEGEIDTTKGAPHTFTLFARPRVRGRLLGPDGTVPPGAYVQIFQAGESPSEDEWGWVEAPRLPVNADGTFDHVPSEFDLVHLDETAESMREWEEDVAFKVRGSAPGLAPAYSERFGVRIGATPVEVTLQLSHGVSLRGQVFDETGAALSSAQISLLPLPDWGGPADAGYGGAWGPPISAVTAADGSFEVRPLLPGRYQVRARRAGSLDTTEIVKVPDDVDVRLELFTSRRIAGVVVMADGTPVPGMRVEAIPTDTRDGLFEPSSVRSSVDGSFVIPDLADQPYHVNVSPTPTAGNIRPLLRENVPAGTTDLRLEAEPGLVIAGVVVQGDGKPAKNAIVSISRNGEVLNAMRLTGDQFKFRGLAPGRYQLTAEQLEGLPGLRRAAGPLVKPTSTSVRFILPRASALRGLVVGPNGKPLGRVHVQATPVKRDGDDDPTQLTPLATQTDADGRFYMSAIEGARYTFQLFRGSEFVIVNSPIVSAGPGDTRLHASEGTRVRGTVQSPKGDPIPSASLFFHDAVESVHQGCGTDSSGNFVVVGLIAGRTYDVTCSHEKYADWRGQMVAGEGSLTIQLALPVRTAGVLVDQRGHPVPRANVQGNLVSGGRNYIVMTDEDGAFEINSMTPGAYTFRVSPGRDGKYKDVGTFNAGDTNIRLQVNVR